MGETIMRMRGPDGRSLLGSPRHALRRWISMYPTMYLPMARLKNEHSVLEARTELVLDGTSRSANTFAAIAFQLAQNDHVRLAHHMHAAASLVAAARRGVPTLITVREPEPTILSSLMREPQVTARQWLKTYVAFYERILPFRSAFAIATFTEVTSDFGAVTRRVNERFATRFREFDHTEQNVQAVFTLIEERAEGPPWQPYLNRFVSGLLSADEYHALTRPYRDGSQGRRRPVPELRIQRPSAQREAAKGQMRERYQDPGLADLRTSAEKAYRAFVGTVGSSAG
jgi:hypothetical protein